jgi:hypothetical protein
MISRRSKNQPDLPSHNLDNDKNKDIKEPRCWFCWLWPFFAAYAAHSFAMFLYPLVFPNSPSPFVPIPMENVKLLPEKPVLVNSIVTSRTPQEDWFAGVFDQVPSSTDMLVHQPFFWTSLLQIADVKIGNWNKATKGFAKVVDRSMLWNDLYEWQQVNEGKTAIVFAKCSLCTLLHANRTNIKGPYIILGTFNDNW